MIRAIIATTTEDGAVTIERSAERDLIAKVIRQGGRQVWVDAVDSDDAERDWLAATFKVPRLLLDWQYRYVNEPESWQLHVCLYQIDALQTTDTERWQFVPMFAAADASHLLTAHSATFTALDHKFNDASTRPEVLASSTAPILYSIIEELANRMLAAYQTAEAVYADVILSATAENVTGQQFRTLLARLERVEEIIDHSFGGRLEELSETEFFKLHESYKYQFKKLHEQYWRSSSNARKQRDAANRALTFAASHSTPTPDLASAELVARVRGLGAMLLIILPIVIVIQLSIIGLSTPIPYNLVIGGGVVALIVALALAGLIGRRGGWF